jgi:diguanylate cyclase (GGDEF)-like protein
MFDVMLARYYYYRFRKDSINADYMKQRCLELFYACDEYVIYFDETKELIQLMMEGKEYKELERMFRRIEKTCKNQDLVNLRLFIENCCIQMYDSLKDEAKLLKSLKRYRVYSEKKAEDNKRSFMATLRLRSELAQQRTKNMFLLAAAETDPLTGIANRFKMNAVIDELFELAKSQNKNLAVEMMDVDCFKQVNDTFGHSKGDELLVNMGKVLKGMTNDRIFVARYGGDEFVIYYYDMTDEEILEKAKYINDAMNKVGAYMGIEGFSVSQGIVNHAPRPMNRAWDYLNAADLALYFVKNHGKASARLVHRATELETLEWNKVF